MNNVCKICGEICKTKKGVSIHIRKHNISAQEYYDKFIKTDQNGKCLVCGNSTKWNKQDRYYRIYCSKECKMSDEHNIIEKRKMTCIEKYGVDNPLKNEDIKRKGQYTSLIKYGYINPMKNKNCYQKARNTCLLKYGVKYPQQLDEVKNKIKETNLERYDSICASNNKEIREKINGECFKKYGVEHHIQRPDIQRKQLLTMRLRKNYILPSGRSIILRGYEPDFLKYVFSNSLLKEDEIDYNPMGIIYYMNSEKHYYYPDFYIPKFNLIVEIKSWYTRYKLDSYFQNKREATINQGFNYICIVDSNYNEFRDKYFRGKM